MFLIHIVLYLFVRNFTESKYLTKHLLSCVQLVHPEKNTLGEGEGGSFSSSVFKCFSANF